MRLPLTTAKKRNRTRSGFNSKGTAKLLALIITGVAICVCFYGIVFLGNKQSGEQSDKFDKERLSDLAAAASSLLRHQQASIGYLLVTVVHWNYIELLENWLCNTQPMPEVLKRTFVVILMKSGNQDVELQQLRQRWVNVTLQRVNADDIACDELESPDLPLGCNDYWRVRLMRLKIMATLADADIPFVLFASDEVWLRNPLQLFWNNAATADIVFPAQPTKKIFKRSQLKLGHLLPVVVSPYLPVKTLLWKLVDAVSQMPNISEVSFLRDYCSQNNSDVSFRTFRSKDVIVYSDWWFQLTPTMRVANQNVPFILGNAEAATAVDIRRRQFDSGWWTLDSATMPKCRSEMVAQALRNLGVPS